jgi:hypothetical protein
MNLEEILQDIHGLNTKLAVLEQQYGLLSEDKICTGCTSWANGSKAAT